MDDYAYYDDVEGLAPCEFCGELIPFMDLILHETGHLAEEEVYEYPLYDDLVNVPPENSKSQVENIVLEPSMKIEEKEIKKSDSKNEPKIAFEKKQTQSSDIKSAPKVVIEEKQQSPIKNNKSEVKTHKDQKIKESSTKNVENLLYGIDIDPVRDLEQEKDAYKLPNIPVLSSKEKEKDEEDINNLSDDDSSESLEEFWKRARDFLKRNRVKNEC